MNHPVLHEVFEQWPVWRELVGYVSTSHPAAADPLSIHGSALTIEGQQRERFVARLYGEGVGQSLDDAERMFDEVVHLAGEGKRPRYGREIGLARLFGTDEDDQ